MSDSSTNPIPYPNHKGVSGIYEIVCTANGKRYIGSAENLMHRRNDHRHYLRTNKHPNIHLQRAWNLYGEGSFEWRVLELCSKDRLLEREQFYIDLLRPELNISPFAGSPMKGRHHTPSVIEGIANKLRGRHYSEEHRRKISLARTGKPRKEETRRKLSEYWKGKRWSSERKEKCSQMRQERFSGENNPTHTHPERLMRGEQVNTAKLNAESVLEIRKLYDVGNVPISKIAKQFGIGKSQVFRIGKREQWKHIP